MSAADHEEPGEQAETLRIMLLGKCGAGKSSSGNTILGREAFKSDMKLSRVTKICEKEVGMVDDQPVAVIDTPGLFEIEIDRKKEEIIREILKCVKLQEPGLHAFVIVVPLGRMTQEDQDTNTLIEKHFGRNVWDYTIVLFTHGDRLEGKTINDVISESEENLRNFIRKCSGGFHVFNNKNPEDSDQVTSFLTKIHTLVALNGRGYYRTDLYPPKERRIREIQESILTTRDKEISQKETELQELHKDQDLQKRKKELWRKEEERARLEAEKKIRNEFNKMILIIILVILVAALLCIVSPGVCLPVLAIAGLTWILIKICTSISGKMTGDVRNKMK